MDRRFVLNRVSETAGVFVLAAGAAMLTVAVVDTVGAEGGVTAAPAPTVTVTPPPQVVTVAPSPPPSRSATPRPSATLVAQRGAIRTQTSPRPPGGSRADTAPGGAVAAEQESPSPDRTAVQSSSCSGRVVDVRLAVLPGCAITVGGSR